MDRHLARLVLEYGEEIFPYIKLRSYYAIYETVPQEVARDLVGDQTLSDLLVSGYVAVDNGNLVFQDGDRWLYEPPPVRPRPKPDSNFDKQLDRIANLAGYPIDYHQNYGKYRKLYADRYREYGFDRIETIAYDNRGVGLKLLLSKRGFASLDAKFEAESR